MYRYFLLHINELMTKSQRGASGNNRKTGMKQGLESSKRPLLTATHQSHLLLFIHLLFILLIGPLSDAPLFRRPHSSRRGVNDPGGLAGFERRLVNQDLRGEGERSKTRCRIPYSTWATAHECIDVCASVCLWDRLS